MLWLKNFALKRPLLIVTVILVITGILGILTYPIHFVFPDTEIGNNIAETISKLITTCALLLLLWRWQWLEESGIANSGSIEMWAVIVVISIYKVITTIFAFTGSLSIVFPSDATKLSHLVYALGTGLLEEVLMRGIVLTIMIQAWGNQKHGLLKSIVLSSLVFGEFHLTNLLVRDLVVVILQAFVVILPGLLYAVLVLHYRSIWGAVVIHSLTNGFLNMRISTLPNYIETNEMWMTYAIVLLPTVIFTVYLYTKLSLKSGRSMIVTHNRPDSGRSQPVT